MSDEPGQERASRRSGGAGAPRAGLAEIGWTPEREAELAAVGAELGRDDLVPGRVVVELRGVFRLAVADGAEMEARLAGRIHHQAEGGRDLPAVGDWVAVSPPERAGVPGRIEAILPRRSLFSRRAAGRESVEQVVAANVDVIFLLTGLDGDFNLRRIERYLAVAFESGATPVVLLSKADLHPDPDQAVAAVEAVAPGVDVHAIAVERREGEPEEAAAARRRRSLETVERYLAPGRTVALLGSSGVGKSTLLNHLAGDLLQATGDVRAGDSRGRHTTTHRELFRLPDGSLVIDTPGMRELQVWEVEEGLAAAFGDIDELARGCRFRDCGHDAEPGCAVRRAVDAGELPRARLESFQRLQAEVAATGQREEERRRKARIGSRAIRRYNKDHRPGG